MLSEWLTGEWWRKVYDWYIKPGVPLYQIRRYDHMVDIYGQYGAIFRDLTTYSLGHLPKELSLSNCNMIGWMIPGKLRINIMADDALAPYVARSSPAMLLTMRDRCVLVSCVEVLLHMPWKERGSLMQSFYVFFVAGIEQAAEKNSQVAGDLTCHDAHVTSL